MLRNSKDRLDVINNHHIELLLNKLPGFRCLKLVGLQSSPASRFRNSADSDLDGRQVQEHGEALFLEREARHFSVT